MHDRAALAGELQEGLPSEIQIHDQIDGLRVRSSEVGSRAIFGELFPRGGPHLVESARQPAQIRRHRIRIQALPANFLRRDDLYLARVVGEKKAREMWYLCEQYTAEDCRQMGLVNKVVPAAELMNEARVWAKKIASMSPTAITLAKVSFNASSEEIRGIGAVALRGLALYYGTEEALEGKNAFLEKRKPEFGRFCR